MWHRRTTLLSPRRALPCGDRALMPSDMRTAKGPRAIRHTFSRPCARRQGGMSRPQICSGRHPSWRVEVLALSASIASDCRAPSMRVARRLQRQELGLQHVEGQRLGWRPLLLSQRRRLPASSSADISWHEKLAWHAVSVVRINASLADLAHPTDTSRFDPQNIVASENRRSASGKCFASPLEFGYEFV